MHAMPKPRPPHLHHETTRHGKKVWVHRTVKTSTVIENGVSVKKRKTKRVQISFPYGSDQFWDQYNALERSLKSEPVIVAKNGTLKWLIENYQESIAFNPGLGPGTQKARKAIFKKVIATGGSLKIGQITEDTITKGLERRKDKPSAANNYLTAVKGLFKWAVEKKHMPIDPSMGVSKIRVKNTPHKDWPLELVDQYCARYPLGTRERLAIDLLLYTGMSLDICDLMLPHMRDGFFNLSRGKTGVDVCVWICPALQTSIEACPSTDLYILPSPKGGPWSHASFGNYFHDWCRAAGIPKGFTAHGLRRSGATIAAERGATHAELMAMFGWSDEKMATHYISRANRFGLAREAGQKLADGIG